MYRRFFSIVLLLLFFSVPTMAQEVMTYKIVAYYSSWSIYARGLFANQIPAEMVTHLNYAFINVSDEGGCMLGDPWADIEYSYPDDTPDEPLRGNFKQLHLLKERNPDLKILMAVGGWTWSGKFSDVALTEESRATFAESCVGLMAQYGFDGLDIDWEYPVGGGYETNKNRPEDKQNFTLLMQALRDQLDIQGEADGDVHYLLTIAAPASASILANYELDKIHEYLDWINVMAYDFAGGWSSETGLHAALYTEDSGLSADAAIQVYLEAGVPAEKLVLGVPFYGRGWKGVDATNNGLHQPYTALAGAGDGYLLYRDIVEMLPTSEYFWDDTAQAAWIYSADEGVMVGFDDVPTLEAKAEYIQANGLGGAMVWELSGDDDEFTLLTALSEGLK